MFCESADHLEDSGSEIANGDDFIDNGKQFERGVHVPFQRENVVPRITPHKR
jgi:hypothetical protein